MHRRTLYFEEKCGVDLDDYRTIEDIDNAVENCIGHKMNVVRIGSPLIRTEGNVFLVKRFGINERIDKRLKE